MSISRSSCSRPRRPARAFLIHFAAYTSPVDSFTHRLTTANLPLSKEKGEINTKLKLQILLSYKSKCEVQHTKSIIYSIETIQWLYNASGAIFNGGAKMLCILHSSRLGNNSTFSNKLLMLTALKQQNQNKIDVKWDERNTVIAILISS